MQEQLSATWRGSRGRLRFRVPSSAGGKTLWDEQAAFRVEDVPTRRPPEILRAGDVPLPERKHPRRPCPQLHARRRGGPLQAGLRLQRAAPDGVGCVRPAGGERGPRAGRASGRMDLGQHRRHAGRAAAHGSVDRLVPRVRHLRPGLLRPAAEAVPGTDAQRLGRAAAELGQLGPGRSRPCWPTSRWSTAAAGGPARRSRSGSWRSGSSASPRMPRRCSTRCRDLDRWPDRVRAMQAKWIGRSEGARIRFALVAGRMAGSTVEVYTTRPDTLFGMSFLAVAPEHPIAAAVAAANAVPRRGSSPSAGRWEPARRRSRRPRSEASIPGSRCAIPFDGRLVPVWIANFVLMEYGTGAIFGCPCGDQRDLDFARKYDLPVMPRGAAARVRTSTVHHRRQGV